LKHYLLRNSPLLFIGLWLLSTAALASPTLPIDNDGLDERLQACAACHGERGHSDDESYYPSIAGKPAGYVFKQLQNFRAGRRHNDIMQKMLANLSDEYMHEIAAYYAAEPIQISNGRGASDTLLTPSQTQHAEKLVEQGDEARQLPACSSCHGDNLAGIAPNIPGLLGLPEAYIQSQLGAWRVGGRNALAPDCMQTVAKALTAAEITAIAGWIARQPIPENSRPAPPSNKKLPLDCVAAQS